MTLLLHRQPKPSGFKLILMMAAAASKAEKGGAFDRDDRRQAARQMFET
jgi:hypothetical protein